MVVFSGIADGSSYKFKLLQFIEYMGRHTSSKSSVMNDSEHEQLRSSRLAKHKLCMA